jgi:hypothetical protein
MPSYPAADPATDWTRSRPDIVVYIPRGKPYNDTDNKHFHTLRELPIAGLQATLVQQGVPL